MAVYPYRPLSLPRETRILTVLPGQADDNLICNLSHLDIESDEPYDALSYCWSKSVAHLRDLDDVVSLHDDPDSQTEPRLVNVRDLLGDPTGEFLYVKYGGVLPDGNIVCDGIEMTVGGELFRALKHLREATEPLRLWVDALCINQADIQERTEHVKVMGSIYKNASTVRIWLGDAIGLEKNIFRALQDLNAIITEVRPELQDLKTPVEAQNRCMSHPKWYDVEWFALAHFLDRAWFERIWVVQELAHAKKAVIQMGRYLIPWEAISRILTFLETYRLGDHIPHTSATKRAMAMNEIRCLVLRGTRISEDQVPKILEKLRDFKSTIPSDKIYGILGILDPAISIEVDYSRGPEHLFIDLAVRYLQGGYMNLLYYCGELHQPTSLRLPSWVPDWTRLRWTSPFFIRDLPCSAAGDTKPQLSIDAAAGKIRVRGRLIDEVGVVDDEAEIPVSKFEPDDVTAYDPDRDQKTKTKEMFRRAQRKRRDAGENMVHLAWPTPEHFSWEKYENMWRTFICNRFADDTIPTTNYGMVWEAYMDWTYQHTATEDEEDESPYSYYRKILLGPLSLEDILKRKMFADFKELYLPAFAGAHKRWCYNRRFFISESERYGWAVDGTCSGDRVAIIYGCKYPFLLRDAGDGTYKIIGDCYIHGLMDGEALGDEFEERELVIS